jgi:hypothetical protein
LGSLLMHLGGHGSLGINRHTRIYSLKFHPIINNNSGTHQVGKTGLLSTNILGFKGGGEDTTNAIIKIHLFLCTTILILSSHQTLCNLCQVFFHHLYLLSHNKNYSNFKIQAPPNRYYYRNIQCRIPIISPSTS